MYEAVDTDNIYKINVTDNILSVTLSPSGRTHSATKRKDVTALSQP